MNIIPIAPPRGVILDKNGVLLAENVPVYVLEITPEHIKNMPQTLKKLKQLLPSITDEDIANFQHIRRQNRSFVPIPLKIKLTEEDVATFASYQYQFPGVSIKATLMRYYPMGEITAHFLGYVGRINTQELQQTDPVNYRATNFIGKTGVERFYEPLLHGRVGYEELETDASGRTLRTLDKINPVSGKKLYLSIDIRIQQAAFDAMKDKRGAVVLMDTHRGEILAMVSMPSFNPNAFVNGISAQEYQRLSSASDRPLFNRAVRGLYPPASTVKPFIALAGLENGIVDTHTQLVDVGWFKLPGSTHAYRDWKKNGHGLVNLGKAITVSCDTYFYKLGNRLGITAIEEALSQFGFGQLTHVDLYEEASGLLPNPRWKRNKKGVAWYPGDTLITAIGQGFMLTSPIQLANAVVALSQNGHRFRPHLLVKSVQSDRHLSHNFNPLEEYPVRVKNDEHWRIISEAMRQVIVSNEGTGYRFGRHPPYTIAGKTGTAQVFGGKAYAKIRQEDIPPQLRDHSLFIGFAPVENPDVAIAVIVENDVVAAQVARQVLDTYFNLYPSRAHL